MQIDKVKIDDITVATLGVSRLDASNALDFKIKMKSIIDDGSIQLIIDLSKLKFMDSSSLGAMVQIMKHVGSYGKLVIVGATGTVADLFNYTRMNKIFSMADSVESAKVF